MGKRQKEKQPRPSLQEAILLAFDFFHASENGMTEQAFFDALAPLGYKSQTIKLELKKLVRRHFLSVEETPEFGNVYKPVSRKSKLN